MHHLHLHLPHPHDHHVALTAAAVAATVAVSVGAARAFGDGADPLEGASTATEQTTDAPTPIVVAPSVPGSSTVPEGAPAAASGPAEVAVTQVAVTGVAVAEGAAAEVIVVEVPAGMRLTRAWATSALGAEVPATSIDPAGARFDGLPAGVYTVGYQVETGVTEADDGAAVSAAVAGRTAPVAVADGASIVFALGRS